MNNELKPIVTLSPFKNFCVTIGQLPTSYLESMSYYEMLVWFTKYLEDTVIPAINNNGEAVTELQEKYVELKSYVDNYFANLDVQEEINKKIDSMVESGELTEIIKDYVDPIINDFKDVVNNELDAQDLEISNFKTTVNNTLDYFDGKIDDIASGAPLVASSTAGMTDTTKVYVNTTDGNWYYYDGDSWEIGGQFQSAALSKETPAIAEVYDTLYNELLSNKISTSITLVTGQANYIRLYYPFKEGDVYKFSLISEGLEGSTGKYEVSTDSVPTPTIKYSTKSNNYFIFTEDATFIRVYIPNARITSAVLCTLEMENVGLNSGIKTEVIDMLNLKEKNYNIITIPEIENKTGNLIYDLEYTEGGVENNTTIYNITTGASSVAEHSQVLKIRDENGNLYYDCTIERKSGSTAKFMNLYDSFGRYLSSVYYNTEATKFSELSNDAYYIVLIRYSTLPRQRILYYGYENQIYHVGSDYDFTNFTALLKTLNTLNDSHNKTIYIHNGSYNIYNEYGGDDYFSTVDMTASNWRNNCAIIPENTHVIGLGKVTLNFEFPNDYSNNSVFSTINCIKSCIIENLTINQSGGRYLVHVETAGGYYNQNIIIKNCILNGNTSTNNIIGSGISKGCHYTFENIIVNSSDQNSLYVHTNGHDGAFIDIKGCVFEKFIDLQNWANQSSIGNKSTRVNIIDTTFPRLILRSLYDSDTVSDFDVYTLSTNIYSIQKVRVNTDPTRHLLIPNP